MEDLFNMCKKGKKAFFKMHNNHYSKIYDIIAEKIILNLHEILKANEKDINKLKKIYITDDIQRYTFDKKKIYEICSYINKIGKNSHAESNIVIEENFNNMSVKKMLIPLGHICVIYKKNPYLSILISILSLKSGNSVSFFNVGTPLNTDIIITKIVQDSLKDVGFPTELMQSNFNVPDKYLTKLLNSKKYVDYVIFYENEETEKFKKYTNVDFISIYDERSFVYIHDIHGMNLAIKLFNNNLNKENLIINKKIFEVFTKNYNMNNIKSLKKSENIYELVEYINSYANFTSASVFVEDPQTISLLKEKANLYELYINTIYKPNIGEKIDSLDKKAFLPRVKSGEFISPEFLMRNKYIVE